MTALLDRLRQIDWSQLDQRLSRIARRVWRWILVFVLRALRAFLAGAGAFALLVLGSLRSAGIERVNICGVLLLLLFGGFGGVVIQRCYKRFAFIRRMSEFLAVKVEAIEEAT